MRLKLIACEVFTRELCYWISSSPHMIDLEFAPKGAHDNSSELRALIQRRIDDAEASARRYDAILLAYGVCGNGTVGLAARTIPLVLPRAHDCCTIFLGSRKRFQEYFADRPSTPFSSAGYMERDGAYIRESSLVGSTLTSACCGDNACCSPAGESKLSSATGLFATLQEYIDRYGEDNGRFIYETLYGSLKAAEGDTVVFIDVPETRHLNYLERCRERAREEGKELIVLQGDSRLLRKLVYGEWDEEFLIVPPGQRIVGIYDWDEIVRADDNTAP